MRMIQWIDPVDCSVQFRSSPPDMNTNTDANTNMTSSAGFSRKPGHPQGRGTPKKPMPASPRLQGSHAPHAPGESPVHSLPKSRGRNASLHPHPALSWNGTPQDARMISSQQHCSAPGAPRDPMTFFEMPPHARGRGAGKAPDGSHETAGHHVPMFPLPFFKTAERS